MAEKERICQFDKGLASSCRKLLVRRWGRAHESQMVPQSPLDDPRNAAFAWARYRRLMRFMALVTLGTVVAACFVLYLSNGFVSVHLYIAAALGIGVMMLLTSALMGLVFLSNGTGHDEVIADLVDDEWGD